MRACGADTGSWGRPASALGSVSVGGVYNSWGQCMRDRHECARGTRESVREHPGHEERAQCRT